MWSWDQLTSCQTDISDLIGLHKIITILPWLCKYRHGVIFAYFAFWDFSWNLNGTLPYWYQQVHVPRSLKMCNQSFFISFWRTKSSRAFSWSSLEDQIESDDCTIIESNKKTHFKIASKWEKSTQFFCLNLLYMKHLVLRMLVHVHQISLEQFHSRETILFFLLINRE